ncbi:MAG: glycoside hydrolase family 15 [Micrococcales bacterium]|nr:glycoside hydrolase family 15 [Micrococcales bacterium]
MRRIAAVVLGMAVALAVTVLLGAERAEPLPTLRNGADWRTTSALAHAAYASTPVERPTASNMTDAAWLRSGSIPGGTARREVVRQALLDLHALMQANGAVAAGPDGPWAYAWPRDNAFVAVAFAVSGHPDDAWRALDFFVPAQLRDDGFEARYRLDGTGPPDDRTPQTDGAGWLLWAIEGVRTASGEPVPRELRALRDRATEHVLHLTEDGRRLPPASPDYWEVPERRVTLGTVAPMVAGLEASSRGYAATGDSLRSSRSVTAAFSLRALIDEHFGPRYERHGDSGGPDAAAAMLLPPFAASAGPGVLAAVRAYADQARRPAGGLAPGVGWKSDGVSWTPETALIAYTAAARGDDVTATRWQDWLARQATGWGSLPEKVLPDGRPAGPAPLAWTAALFVLTEHELAQR